MHNTIESLRNAMFLQDSGAPKCSIENDSRMAALLGMCFPALAQSVLNMSEDLVRLGVASTDMVPNQPDLDAGPLFFRAVLYAQTHQIGRVIADPGRMISVKIETPANHMTEESRWDYRVTIRFKNSALATTADPEEERLIKQLWPDQATYQREEQRRFEILLAHWDFL